MKTALFSGKRAGVSERSRFSNLIFIVVHSALALTLVIQSRYLNLAFQIFGARLLIFSRLLLCFNCLE